MLEAFILVLFCQYMISPIELTTDVTRQRNDQVWIIYHKMSLKEESKYVTSSVFILPNLVMLTTCTAPLLFKFLIILFCLLPYISLAQASKWLKYNIEKT